MGFRHLLRRAVKPAAMVGVVGFLSLSLVITTPSTARALVEYDKIAPTATRILGGVKTVAPVAMAAASFTPVGLALRLGFLAFSTADLWMPLVTEAFGTPDTEGPSNPGGTGTQYGVADPNYTLGAPGPAGTTGRSASIPQHYACGGSSCGVNHHLALRYMCKVTATGVITEFKTIVTNIATVTSTNNLSGQTVSCASGSTIEGLEAGLAGDGQLPLRSGQSAAGPANKVIWGTLVTGGFDPRGANVGYQGRSECIDAQGTISWVEGPITPGNNDGGTMLMPSCEKAGKGHGTGRTQVKGFKPDGTTETVWDTGTNPLSDPATPLCDPGRATSGCVMEVLKDENPCATGDVECENWSEEAPKDPTRWKCKFGPYTLPLSSCNLLERAYVPGGSPLNDPNTDGNPSTSSPLGPDGQPAPAPTPITNPAPGGNPAAAPGGAGQPGPGADSQAAQCWPTGWGMLNPLEWVYKPVVCAAKALFEPTKSVQTRVTNMQSQFSNKVPVSWFGTEFGTVAGGACPADWKVSFQGQDYSLICGTEADSIIRGFRPVLGAMLVMAMVWPLIRSLFYAAIPVFKVNPS